jgi:hypothetical protein
MEKVRESTQDLTVHSTSLRKSVRKEEKAGVRPDRVSMRGWVVIGLWWRGVMLARRPCINRVAAMVTAHLVVKDVLLGDAILGQLGI